MVCTECVNLTETRSAVVEVGDPWNNVTVKRKLPPLKYYYDFEMSKYNVVHNQITSFVPRLKMQFYVTCMYRYASGFRPETIIMETREFHSCSMLAVDHPLS